MSRIYSIKKPNPNKSPNTSVIDRLAITSGHPNGIGPEIILKSFFEVCHNLSSRTPAKVGEFKKAILSNDKKEFIIIGSLAAFKWHAQKSSISFSVIQKNPSEYLNLDEFLSETDIYQITKLGNRKKMSSILTAFSLWLIDIPIKTSSFSNFDRFMKWAIPSKRFPTETKERKALIARALAGENASRVLEVSAQLIRSGRVGGVINAPVSKESISRFSTDKMFKKFIGQTEFYARIFSTQKFSMTFLSPSFNLVLLTTHIPLSQVTSQITAKLINKGIDHAYEVREYLCDRKKILFLGVDPHAGENGKIGKVDNFVSKVIARHRYGKYIEGPIPADTAFIKVFAGKYRVVISAYHDQGLIPLKSIGNNFHYSVNVTWGLPFVRVSVDHGTAFDIVGKDQAHPHSFISAWKIAWSLLNYKKKLKRMSML